MRERRESRPAGGAPDRAADRTTATKSSDASIDDATDYLADLHRRRAESHRLAILDSGHADPWRYLPPEPSERNRQAARSTYHHLAQHGLVDNDGWLAELLCGGAS